MLMGAPPPRAWTPPLWLSLSVSPHSSQGAFGPCATPSVDDDI
eukprot:SAG11_NODE_29724_length_308_cov_0.373206_1_plen_42_part_01